MNDILRDRFDELSERVEEVIADVKPRLRGWLHLATAPLTLAAGIVLVVLVPRRHDPDRLGRLRGHRAGAVHRLGDLSPRHLVAHSCTRG